MIVSIEGEEKSGKSTFAYTSPLPIVAFAFDLGSDRAIYGTQFDKYFKGLEVVTVPHLEKVSIGTPDILIYELPRPIQLDQERLVGFMDLWAYFIRLCSTAILDPKISTVVIDTMTLCRRIKADAYLQELQELNPQRPRKQLLQIEYGHANDSIRNIYDLAAYTRKNMVVVHHLTDEYKPQLNKDGQIESMSTGVRQLEGLTGTYRHIDIAIRNEKKKANIVSTITVCGLNLALEGQQLPESNWNSLVDILDLTLDGRIKFQRRL